MTTNKKRVCPIEHAGALDISLRKLIQNPRKILRPYVTEGMTVLDLGCGPGFFSIDMAKMVGMSGKVIAADLQDGMLKKLEDKIRNTKFQNIIKLHKCQEDKIGLSEKVDFVLLFFMLHEVPDQPRFLKEISTLLKPDAKIMIVEPPFHVSKKEFANLIESVRGLGFKIIDKPKVFFCHSILISRAY
jgi:ubiquinone/menaquinone biosynthesis C-methylase UbiE